MWSQFWQSLCVSAENTQQSHRTVCPEVGVSPMSSINPFLNILAHVVNEFSLPPVLSHLGEVDGSAPLNDLSVSPSPPSA